MKKEVAVKATALIVDGAYARIQARTLGGKIDFARLRTELEEMNSTEFEECWYFDSQRYDARGNSELAAEFHALKYAHPQGPQFQVEMFSTKRYNCRCPDCGNRFTQNVQKSVDNGASSVSSCSVVIATSTPSLGYVRNVLRKEVWVVGYWDTMSGDLQQLASRIIWIHDIWERVMYQRRSFGGLPQIPFAWDVLNPSCTACRSSFCPQQRQSDRCKRFNGPMSYRRRDTSRYYVIVWSTRNNPPRSPRRVARRYRSPSPPLGGDSDQSNSTLPLRSDNTVVRFEEQPEFDEVNMSGSGDEDTWSCSSPAPFPTEADIVEAPSHSLKPTLTVKGEQLLPFLLPMAVPVASSSTTSTE